MNIRKGLIAAATVAAVSFTGASAVSAQENATVEDKQVDATDNGGEPGGDDGNGGDDASGEGDGNGGDDASGEGDGNGGDDASGEGDGNGGDDASGEGGDTKNEKDDKNEGSSSSSDANPTDIKAWIGVFTAVISALSAAFAFFNRYFK